MNRHKELVRTFTLVGWQFVAQWNDCQQVAGYNEVIC